MAMYPATSQKFSRRTLLLQGATALAFAPPALKAQAKRPPNIVFLFADDLGWRDVPFNGSDFMETPRLDALRREGVAFTNAYASAANCAPSRACMLSGQYTPRHGVYAVGSTKRGPVEEMRLEPVPNEDRLSPEKITFAEALREAGYITGLFGKWHLGNNRGSEPMAQGFNVYYDSRFPDPNRKRDMPDDPKGLFSIAAAACSFMETNRERPFLCYIAQHAIHTNLEARPGSLKKFQAKPKGKQHGAAMYAACTYDLDAAVGVVLDKLKELGLEENTVVLFTSDNGGTQQSSQEPLRGSKGGYYEGGIREPMLVRWPGVTKPGSVCETPVTNIDFYPTFLAIANGKPAGDDPLDGESLVPLFGGDRALEDRAIYWHFPGYLDDPVVRGRDPLFRTRPVTAMRKGDWKLLLYHEEWQLDGGWEKRDANAAVELYNLREDVGERADLALANPAQRDAMIREMLAWMKQSGATMPAVPNPGYAPSPGVKRIPAPGSEVKSRDTWRPPGLKP
ncbi:MAG: sulfatase [Bryobacterales bacterium]|nr:sulfatase [Bryobacterales bacterium]